MPQMFVDQIDFTWGSPMDQTPAECCEPSLHLLVLRLLMEVGVLDQLSTMMGKFGQLREGRSVVSYIDPSRAWLMWIIGAGRPRPTEQASAGADEEIRCGFCASPAPENSQTPGDRLQECGQAGVCPGGPWSSIIGAVADMNIASQLQSEITFAALHWMWDNWRQDWLLKASEQETDFQLLVPIPSTGPM
jgi:hypothetical protein